LDGSEKRNGLCRLFFTIDLYLNFAYEPDYQFKNQKLIEAANEVRALPARDQRSCRVDNPFKNYSGPGGYYCGRIMRLMHFLLESKLLAARVEIKFHHRVNCVKPYMASMFSCIVDALANKNYLEAYYRIQLDYVLPNLALYKKQSATYKVDFFGFDNVSRLSVLEESWLRKVFYGEFFEEHSLANSDGASIERMLKMPVIPPEPSAEVSSCVIC
jgi:hypothetical protein